MEDKPKKLVILYATQTGNALDAAEHIQRQADRRSCHVTLLSTHNFNPSLLALQEVVIFVVSTTGQGDAPDSFKSLWKFLLQRNLSKTLLQGLRYAVFGLGDSAYQKFNFVAKKLDRRLSDLGAVPIVERGLGDDQHPSGYEGALDPWLTSLWFSLHQIDSKFFPNGPNYLIPNDKLIDQPKIQITYHATNVADLSLSNSDLKHIELQIERARSMSPANFPLHKRRPDCFLKMVKNQRLCKVGCGRDVRHFEFEFVSSSNDYEVGDVIEILPGQNPDAVDSFMERCNSDPDSLITVHSREMENGFLDPHGNGIEFPIKLRKFVELTMDIASASPRRYFFEVMSFFATAEHEKERLQYFASPEGRDDLYEYNQKERRTVLEVLKDFPSVQMPFEWLVQLVPPLKSRAFSISSSPSAHPNQVHLTVNIVSWKTPFKRNRNGLCSTWLASLDPQEGACIAAWFQKGLLLPPPPFRPIILVGPGTGCAPFRGFVEERALQNFSGSAAPVIFFFGCRNEENDFLYKDFWLSHTTDDGLLSERRGGGFYAAFSRDQPQKVYVQHKIREHSKRVWNLLSEGAAIYVAGSSTKMPSDVMSAFEEIISKEAGVSRENAAMVLRRLEKDGKYHVEAWS